jgi:hypothetical protein
VNRFLICLALVGVLVLPVVSQAKHHKVTLAHIGDAMVTYEEDIYDDTGMMVIGTKYTITGYYNVIEVSSNAVSAHEGHYIEVMGVMFEDIIPYEGEKGDHFTVEETVEVLY